MEHQWIQSDGKSYEGMIRRGRKVLTNNDEIAAQSRGAQGKRRECKKLSRDILTWGRVGKRAKNEWLEWVFPLWKNRTGGGGALRGLWKGKENERKEDLWIPKNPLAEEQRGNQMKTRMWGWQWDGANDYRIVWIRRGLSEQTMSKRWVTYGNRRKRIDGRNGE